MKRKARDIILELLDLGYTNSEIFKQGILSRDDLPITMRYIQSVKEDWYILQEKQLSSLRFSGRTSLTPIFSYYDIEFMIHYPDKKEDIIKRRFIEYYKNRNEGLPTIKLANIVLERDNYECKNCGSVIDLECHHFQNKGSNNPDDCITLCHKCHPR